MPPLTVVIVDDEPLARDCVRLALAGQSDIVVVAECANAAEAVRAIREEDPDLVFLDVQLPGQDGFAVIEETGPSRMPAVILVTAFDQYALKAFDVHAVDYVLKPFEDARLLAAVDRARARIREAGPAPGRAALRALLESLATGDGGRRVATTDPGHARRLMVRDGDSIRFVPVRDVDWFESDGNQVVLHVGTAAWRLRSTLKELLSRLDPALFARIHRGTIVQLSRIREVQPWFGGDYIALLHDGQKLRISRTFLEAVLRPIS
jgi:two-component system, LytTR family, response regulator